MIDYGEARSIGDESDSADELRAAVELLRDHHFSLRVYVPDFSVVDEHCHSASEDSHFLFDESGFDD
jgi:hypothetical protein